MCRQEKRHFADDALVNSLPQSRLYTVAQKKDRTSQFNIAYHDGCACLFRAPTLLHWRPIFRSLCLSVCLSALVVLCIVARQREIGRVE